MTEPSVRALTHPQQLENKHQIDSPMPQNAKPLPNSDLSQAANDAYKQAYKKNRKVTPISEIKIIQHHNHLPLFDFDP